MDERTAKMLRFGASNLSMGATADYVGTYRVFGGAMRIRFDRGPTGGAAWFGEPRQLIRADDPADVAGALDAMDAALADGYWLAGYASYELGYVLEAKLRTLMPQNRRLPLIAFGVFDGETPVATLPAGPATLGPFTPGWDATEYTIAFDLAHEFIGAGDIYQTNLTFALAADVTGTPEALYAGLSKGQPVGHGSIVLQDGLPAILSRSPELFFRTDAKGKIQTRPMKGTQPRSTDPVEDAGLKVFLQNDPKNRAENLMIVDLLRNDLSRICTLGSVRVPELFRVETYATVHQMISLIEGQLLPKISLGDTFRALFPCGSVTGAPKVRAMQIIHDLEQRPRDIYCGSIGWAAPDGRADFNVAIRTILVENGRADLSVGGGVVWDSTAVSEYEEALWKTRFAKPFQT